MEARAATDVAWLVGQDLAVRLNGAATAQQSATVHQAQLLGLRGLVAAATATPWVSPEPWIARTLKTEASVGAVAAWQKALLSDPRARLRSDLHRLAASRGLPDLDVASLSIDLPRLPSARTCVDAVRPPEHLGLDPSLSVKATATGVSASFGPPGPPAFHGAFSAARSQCLGTGLVPLSLAKLPHTATRSVGVSGRRLTGALAVRSGQEGSATYVARLASGPALQAAGQGGEWAVLVP